MRTTVRPSLQAAATSALGGRLGGIAVRAAARRRRARARRPGRLRPAAAGLVVQDHHARRGAAGGRDDGRRVVPGATAATLEGVRLRNASDESCGGTLTDSFAHSCNSVFAPLGARLGAKRLVAYAERFGFNERAADPGGQAEQDPARRATSTDDLAVGASAIGQDRDLATPLVMASVGATIANGGVRARPRLVRSEKRTRRRVVKRRVARPGARHDARGRARRHGHAAALPGVDVAGKTGTAELVPTADGRGPLEHRRVVRRVRPGFGARGRGRGDAVGAGQGGASAAPVAREVLGAGL